MTCIVLHCIELHLIRLYLPLECYQSELTLCISYHVVFSDIILFYYFPISPSHSALLFSQSHLFSFQLFTFSSVLLSSLHFRFFLSHHHSLINININMCFFNILGEGDNIHIKRCFVRGDEEEISDLVEGTYTYISIYSISSHSALISHTVHIMLLAWASSFLSSFSSSFFSSFNPLSLPYH